MPASSLRERPARNAIERAVGAVIAQGEVRTYDLGGSATTSAMAAAVAQAL